MNEQAFLEFLMGQGQQCPPEQCGAALLTLIGMRLQGIDIRRPTSGLVVAHPTA